MTTTNLDNCIVFINAIDNHTIGTIEFETQNEAELAASKLNEFEECYMMTDTELDRYNEFIKFMKDIYNIDGTWVSVPGNQKINVSW